MLAWGWLAGKPLELIEYMGTGGELLQGPRARRLRPNLRGVFPSLPTLPDSGGTQSRVSVVEFWEHLRKHRQKTGYHTTP